MQHTVDPMPDWVARYDSNLRIALALIKSGEWVQLAARTGIVCGAKEPQYLGLFVELDPDLFDRSKTPRLDPAVLARFQMEISTAYLDEFAENPALLSLPVRIPIEPSDPARTTSGDQVEQVLRDASTSGAFVRIHAAIPHGRCEQSIAALQMPAPSALAATHLTGRNIVVGILDDGCAFAHPDFLEISGSGASRTYATRVLLLCDQSRSPTPEDMAVGWKKPNGFRGRELSKAVIDAAIAAHSSPLGVDEDAVYAALRYAVGQPGARATHGTKVMGIAAGNGNSLMGHAGLAPEAGIVFVQLPPDQIATAPQTFSDFIGEGVAYVFRRATQLHQLAAVVNISYGGYSGPHDGTTAVERHIDHLLATKNRAVVVSAGNGFEADCHATATLQPGQQTALHWNLNSGDRTANDCEVWYDGDATLTAALTLPDGSETLGPFSFLPNATPLQLASGKTVGNIQHVEHDPTNGDRQLHIALGATASDPLNPTTILAPAGRWTLTLANPPGSGKPATFHAWIRRDDLGPDWKTTQSRFDRAETHPGHTFGDLCGGRLAIAVGAFNAATNEVCAYSACGPTRRTKKRPVARMKPEICAPAEELALGGGVLTTASRSALPKRMNGTSAAAPHVTGVIALVFDLCRNHKNIDVTAAMLRPKLIGRQALLKLNRRAALDDRLVKQADVWSDLIGVGAVSAKQTLDGF